MQRRRELMGMQTGGLPGAYRGVEYIGVNGYAGFDTGIAFNSNTDMLKVKFNVIAQSGSFCWVFGGVSDTSRYFGVQVGTNARQNIKVYYNAFGESVQSSAYGATLTTEFNPTGAYLDGTQVAAFRSFTTNNLALLNFYFTEATLRKLNAMIFEVEYNGAKILPCYRKSDNVIGFYDTGRNIFLTRNLAYGDTALIVGPDMN
jgi:hypothetical protein